MRETPKIFLNKLRNIFCRFFDRKMTYFVRDSREERNTFLFTNVPFETILLYDDAPHYSYHKVVVHDEEFLDDFYTIFPLLKDTDCIIDIAEFTVGLTDKMVPDLSNESPDPEKPIMHPELETAVLSKEGESVRLYVGETVSRTIGTLLIAQDVSAYWGYFKLGQLSDPNPFICPTNGLDMSEKYTIWTVPVGENRETKIILYPGYNIPSVAKYQMASKDTGTISIRLGREGLSYLVSYDYHGALLDATGTQPGQRWYMLHTQPNNKE